MRAIKLGLYAMAGLIASSSITMMAQEIEAIMWMVVALGCLWLWSITAHGHDWGMSLFRLNDAEMATLRVVSLVLFLTGILINWSFKG